MKVFIKNMVCARCILVVERELDEMGIQSTGVELGFAAFENDLTDEQLSAFENRLVPLGFEIIKEPRKRQVEEVKALLIRKLQQARMEEHFSIRQYLSAHISKDYSHISKMFSQKEGRTIEQYFILLKIEKAKELLSYGEKTLNEIAWTLGYSSVQHLSSQFKRISGVSTRDFRLSLSSGRKPIDRVGSDD
ncbi:MAG: helix-turn-helix transcriptional regulator [Williamsia sp.]|nr:helix-turn-helix transcriptional regulator [Williamsia sp.]